MAIRLDCELPGPPILAPTNWWLRYQMTQITSEQHGRRRVWQHFLVQSNIGW
jgi:hypothetical protein